MYPFVASETSLPTTNTSDIDPILYEARAIVLGNMGQHKQALDIYVFKLKDPEKAEE